MNDAGRLSHAPIFYTVREAADVLRCHQNTLYRAIHDDAFPRYGFETDLSCRLRSSRS